jgi:hypothetical protein
MFPMHSLCDQNNTNCIFAVLEYINIYIYIYSNTAMIKLVYFEHTNCALETSKSITYDVWRQTTTINQ